MPTRREFLSATSLAAVGSSLPALPAYQPASLPARVKPARLKPGDQIGLINPAGATFNPIDLDVIRETMTALGLRARVGKSVLNRYGYLAGRDEERAADVNEMFRDAEVRAILCVRGGWGCARILPLLDYGAIQRQPKILLGYSDITALHAAIQVRSGVVTFHGPVGISRWNKFNVDWIRRILFNGEAVTLQNDSSFDADDSLVQTQNRIRTITPGVARGRLVGGNLTVLTAILGSPYVPEWKGRVLFLEDVQEAPYRIDRMLTQLQLAGVLSQVSAVVFGTCDECNPGQGFGSLTLDDIFLDHLKPLGIPAWYGAMIGHVEKQFTIPLGIEAEVDATKGTIKLLEPAVL
ncbi:MAG TPA: LD-carboxypeptidase [Vicinamibacterales bacterium]|nr:LD-carboxypeptidase [Vicinamibacterales bacterium]